MFQRVCRRLVAICLFQIRKNAMKCFLRDTPLFHVRIMHICDVRSSSHAPHSCFGSRARPNSRAPLVCISQSTFLAKTSLRRCTDSHIYHKLGVKEAGATPWARVIHFTRGDQVMVELPLSAKCMYGYVQNPTADVLLSRDYLLFMKRRILTRETNTSR
jgi:hypothetical protein